MIESTHSFLKGKGTLKTMMNNFNLVSYVNHVKLMNTKRVAKTIKKIEQHIKSGRKMTHFVRDFLRDELELSLSCELKERNETFSVVEETTT